MSQRRLLPEERVLRAVAEYALLLWGEESNSEPGLRAVGDLTVDRVPRDLERALARHLFRLHLHADAFRHVDLPQDASKRRYRVIAARWTIVSTAADCLRASGIGLTSELVARARLRVHRERRSRSDEANANKSA